jgi:hypothetical protein
MQVFGKSLADYIRFGRVVLIATAVVGLARLGLSQGGAPDSVSVWFSLTAVMMVGMLDFSIRTRTTGFGSYRHLLVLLVLQLLLSQVIVATGIAITAVTGAENIFSVPEFSGDLGRNYWAHAATHLLGGSTVFALILWLPASLIHFITGRVAGTAPGRPA